MYEYCAKVVSVYDGDTITVDIDLGFGIVLKKQKLRLLGINTPEVRGEEKILGKKVRDLVREKILDKVVTIKTVKDKKGKYGRWLATIIYEDEDINNWLLIEGHAVSYMKKK
jgi:micrococcal nuclease|tara:strand:+ start:6093 stop:6428 length:336 start_codon:yes stop_codon:yes gene_type:complete